MILIYSSPNSAEIGLLQSRLEGAGIACELRNEIGSQVLMGAVFYPELYQTPMIIGINNTCLVGVCLRGFGAWADPN